MEICTYCDHNVTRHAPDCIHAAESKMIAGRSLAEWREFARRDDCLDRMTPSDLRQILGAIPDV